VVCNPKFQVAVLHQLAQALLLHKAVDERHVGGQMIVDDHTADGGAHVLLHVHRGARCAARFWCCPNALVSSMTFAGYRRSLNRRERFHFAHLERDQHVFARGESTAFALGARPGFGSGNSSPAPCPASAPRWGPPRAPARENIVRRQHQRRRFDLRFQAITGMWTAIWSPSKSALKRRAKPVG